MKTKKAFVLALALIMLLSVLTGCGSSAPATSAPAASSQSQAAPAKTDSSAPAASEAAPAKAYKDTVTFSYTSEIANGDPYFRVSTQDRIFTNLTHDTLFVYNFDTQEVDPKVAISCEDVNGDGLVWDVKLHEGVQFHDDQGQPYGELTAEDVKFTWEWAGKDGKGECGYTLSAYTKMDSIEVVDPYTVRFNLNTPLYDFAFYLTGDAKVLCKKAFDEFGGTEEGRIKAAEVGCGPYYLNYAESMDGYKHTATRFDGYWQGIENYPTKNLVMLLQADANACVASLQSGETDLVLSVGATLMDQVASTPGLKLVTGPGSSNTFMGFNYHNYWKIDDLEMRQAFAYAIDRTALAQILYQGKDAGRESWNFAVSAIPGYKEIDNPYPTDVAKAKEIMEKHGYNDSNRLKLRCAYYVSYQNIFEYMQATLKQIYVDLEPNVVDGSQFATYISEGEGYDICLNYASMGGAMFYDFDRFLYSNSSTGTRLYGWTGSDYDALQDAAMNSGSYDNMKAQFADIQVWAAENLPFIPLVCGNLINGMVENLEGFQPCPNLQLLNVSTIGIPE